jgi:hypothetical protein
MRGTRVGLFAAVAALLACPLLAAPGAGAAVRVRLGYLSWVRASWTIAVADCPSCSGPQRSGGTFRALAGRAAVRRRGVATVVELSGRSRRSRLACDGSDLDAAPLPAAPRALRLVLAARGRRLGFRWALPACDPEIDQPVADALLPATSRSRAYLRRDTAYLRLRGRRAFDLAPDSPDAPPDVGPAPGHWRGTLTWSLTAKLTRCRTLRSKGRRVRRCAF